MRASFRPTLPLVALVACGLLAGRSSIASAAPVPDDPTVSFQFNGSSAPEKITAVKLHVVVSAPSASAVTVKYKLTGGTADRGTAPTFGVDFVMPDGTLTFAPGVTGADVPITVVNDAFPEDDETIEVTLSSPTGATLGPIAVHTYTIVDDDAKVPKPEALPKVQFLSPASSGQESDTPVKLTVVLDKASDSIITVDYAVSGGTATGGGTDYTLNPGTLVIPAGQTFGSISLAIVDDTLHESDETVRVILSNPNSKATLGTIIEHKFTIIDNDPIRVSFEDSASTSTEANETISIPLHLNAASDQAISVDYKLGGTAKGAGFDYTLDEGTVTFPPNVLDQTIGLKIVDNKKAQPTRTVVLSLTNPTTGTLGDFPVHTHAILDNDQAKIQVQFAAETTKNFESVADVQIEVDLNVAAKVPVTVDYASTGTQLVNGVDYKLTPGTLTFAAGQTKAFISATIVDNAVVNADRPFDVVLSNPTNAELGTISDHAQWVLDDDSSAVSLTLFLQAFAADGGKTMTVVGPKSFTVNPGGVAVDKGGNYYISDRGDGTAGGGSILMVPKGTRDALRIITGLSAPGDVELSQDQRSLFVAEAGGNITNHVFGVSVQLVNGNQFAGGILYVNGNEGTKSARISPDGYFHVENILTSGQTASTVDIVLEHGGFTKTFYKVPLGQPGQTVTDTDVPYGQIIVKLQF